MRRRRRISSLADTLQSYEEAPRPLTDEERRLLKRMFSDYFEVPSEWKRELKADLERDPPILGRQTLGSLGDAKIPPETLSGGGNLGSSSVGYIGNALTFSYPTGPSIRANGSILEFWTDELRFGAAYQDVALKRISAGHVGVMADTFHIGAFGDVQIVRQSAEQLSLWTHRLALQKTAGPNETPLQLNVGGVLKDVLVGPNGGTGGSGIRLLYVVA